MNLRELEEFIANIRAAGATDETRIISYSSTMYEEVADVVMFDRDDDSIIIQDTYPTAEEFNIREVFISGEAYL